MTMKPMMHTYLDHNASTPVWEEALNAMREALGVDANPSSPHAPGRRARAIIDTAREQTGGLLRVSPLAVVFTSGGAEANGLALAQAVPLGAKRLLVSAGEHPCVLQHAAAHSLPTRIVQLDKNGCMDLDDLDAALCESDDIAFLACMAANNETGAIQPIEQAAERMHGAGGFIHCDAVQTIGRIPFYPADYNLDFCALSAHKMGGPAGVGALACLRETLEMPPPFQGVILGGGQERGWRSGTENIAGIAGLGAAASLAPARFETFNKLGQLRGKLEDELVSSGNVTIFSKGANRMPNTSCFAMNDTTQAAKAESSIIALDLMGIAVSSGSACSSGKLAPSHVLTAMGVGSHLAQNALRISLGWQTTRADIERFLESWQELASRIKTKENQKTLEPCLH
ncbi:MAG: cysteine desulfurase family protein [Hyphomicrobiales bacterium]|nr:cysteine desulfurase family protein [Hyphomicrobiales bacterium]